MPNNSTNQCLNHLTTVPPHIINKVENIDGHLTRDSFQHVVNHNIYSGTPNTSTKITD